MTKLTRTDCQRDNVKILCKNATTLGFGKMWCKRGNWVMYDSDNFHYIGRSIGRVTCEGKIYIEIAQASPTFDYAYIRWIEPEQVREIRINPPRQVFQFFASDNWQPETIFSCLEHGVSDMHDQLETA